MIGEPASDFILNRHTISLYVELYKETMRYRIHIVPGLSSFQALRLSEMENMLDSILSSLGSNLGKENTTMGILLPVIITSTWLTLFALQYRFTRSQGKTQIK